MLEALEKPMLANASFNGMHTRRYRAVMENVGYAVLYFLSYWALDWFSFLYAPEKIDITPWNPPVGATVIFYLCAVRNGCPSHF